jgi:DNA-binding HxlR family transcriptional regulator
MEKENLLKILSKSHAIKILCSLCNEEMRFVDLKNICESNRTRSARLKELEAAGLVRTIPKMINKRAYTFYEITPLGREALQLAEKLILLGSKNKS